MLKYRLMDYRWKGSEMALKCSPNHPHSAVLKLTHYRRLWFVHIKKKTWAVVVSGSCVLLQWLEGEWVHSQALQSPCWSALEQDADSLIAPAAASSVWKWVWMDIAPDKWVSYLFYKALWVVKMTSLLDVLNHILNGGAFVAYFYLQSKESVITKEWRDEPLTLWWSQYLHYVWIYTSFECPLCFYRTSSINNKDISVTVYHISHWNLQEPVLFWQEATLYHLPLLLSIVAHEHHGFKMCN